MGATANASAVAFFFGGSGDLLLFEAAAMLRT
jgi:hypothetical protein